MTFGHLRLGRVWGSAQQLLLRSGLHMAIRIQFGRGTVRVTVAQSPGAPYITIPTQNGRVTVRVTVAQSPGAPHITISTQNGRATVRVIVWRTQEIIFQSF